MRSIQQLLQKPIHSVNIAQRMIDDAEVKMNSGEISSFDFEQVKKSAYRTFARLNNKKDK